MSKIAIITDSTAYLEKNFLEHHPVTVVPLSVHFGGVIEKEGLPGSFSLFYEKLSTSSLFPTTSQPSAGEFLEAYEKLIAEGQEIIVMTISSGISGTYQSAQTAKELSDAKDKISVIDSQTTAGNLKALVEIAVGMASEGKGVQEIVSHIEDQKNKSGIRLTVSTLDYLKKGGRLSGTGAFIGKLLNIKPVLGLIDGVVQPVSKARGMKKAISEMVKAIPPTAFTIHIAHAMAQKEAEILCQQVEKKFPDASVILSELGPVIGAHLGPGAMGVLYLYK